MYCTLSFNCGDSQQEVFRRKLTISVAGKIWGMENVMMMERLVSGVLIFIQKWKELIKLSLGFNGERGGWGIRHPFTGFPVRMYS